MRFKKGSKVEVLCKKHMPLGAWRCAEIISGNGHTYSVRYDSISSMENGKTEDRIPTSAIRPCPPPVGSMMNLAAGDIAEVLDAGSWKAAIVLKVLDGDSCLVRLLGSFTEFKIHISKTRPRRTWQDEKWVFSGMAYGSHETAKFNNLSNLNSYEAPQVHTRVRLPAGNDGLALQDNNYGQDSYIVSAKSLKRASPFCSSQVEARPSKARAIQKRTEHQQVIPGSLSPLLKKVDAVASPRDILGEKDMHASFSKQTTGHLEIERENFNGSSSCFFQRSTEFSDSDTDACSVGSCSVNSNGMNKFSSNVLAGPSQDADGHSSDAESFCGREDEEERCSLPLKEEEAASRIHSLRVHFKNFIDESPAFSGPKLEACLACFQRSKDDAGVCTLHLAQRMGQCFAITSYITIYGRQVISLFPLDHFQLYGTVDASCAKAEPEDNTYMQDQRFSLRCITLCGNKKGRYLVLVGFSVDLVAGKGMRESLKRSSRRTSFLDETNQRN